MLAFLSLPIIRRKFVHGIFGFLTLCLNSLTGCVSFLVLSSIFSHMLCVFHIIFFLSSALLIGVPEFCSLDMDFMFFILLSGLPRGKKDKTCRFNWSSWTRCPFQNIFQSFLWYVYFYINIILKIDSSTFRIFYSFLESSNKWSFLCANLKSYLFSKT